MSAVASAVASSDDALLLDGDACTETASLKLSASVLESELDCVLLAALVARARACAARSVSRLLTGTLNIDDERDEE